MSVEEVKAFHFLRPEWLWLLVPALLLYVVILRRQDVVERWKRIIDPDLLESLLVGRHHRWRFRPVHSVCLAIFLSALGLAGPTWTREQPPFTEDKAPLVIALDLSRDMDAIDVQPTRLERAKLKVHDIMKARQGSRTALVVYAATAHMVLPLSSDASLMDLYAQALSTDLIPPGRKDTRAALAKVDQVLSNETIPGTIVFITCGVEQSAFAAFAQHNDNARNRTLVLAVGTPEGGPLRSASGGFSTDNGRRIFSRLDVDSFKELKSSAGVPVSTVTVNDDDVNWIQRHALNHLQAIQNRDAKIRWVDQGYWLTIPVALFTCLWFRKGWTIRWVASGIVFFALWQPQAASARDFHFIDLWLTPDQQGRYYFEKGEYQQAADRFHDPMWKGLALSKAGKYDDAIDAFALVDTAESWFNQGNALAYLKKYPEAVEAYSEALKRRPDWRDAEDNLAIVNALIPPPQKDDEQQYDPTFKPDQFKFDKKKGKGKKGLVNAPRQQSADVWMRSLQVNPADFLRRKFAIESEKGQGR